MVVPTAKEEFDMFSSSSAPRRQTEMSTRVTWIDSESRFPYCQIRKCEAKYFAMSPLRVTRVMVEVDPGEETNLDNDESCKEVCESRLVETQKQKEVQKKGLEGRALVELEVCGKEDRTI